MSAGRSCPLSYRYAPADFRAVAESRTDTLYVVGGLYGNQPALATVLAMFSQEPGARHLLFNGDFNWFNVDAQSFAQVNETVLQFDAIRGNVETELAAQAADADAGCGCAYPDWVDDAVVGRSNLIMQRLAQTAAQFPQLQARLAALPMWKRIDVGGVPVAIVHGDAESLAGWGFAPDHLHDAAQVRQVEQWFDSAGVRIFACSHTCSPAFCPVINAADEFCLVANNGAAGMPNFFGMHHGLLTRIATTPYDGPACYSVRVGSLFVEALAIPYDNLQWQADFLQQWPEGSAAHDSYWGRISQGPACSIEDALQFLRRKDVDSSLGAE